MSPRALRILWGMLIAGVAGRAIFAFATVGVDFDINNYIAVDEALRTANLDVYSAVNGDANPGDALRWPYLSGFFPLVLLSGFLTRELGLDFHGIIQIWPILADAGIAWLVQAYLGRRGASEDIRLLAAGLVLLGPCFAVVSGYHGHFDSVAILPAVAALVVWESRAGSADRAVAAGLLIGAGIALKTVPGLMIFALLPSCRGRREVAGLLLGAAVIPLVAALPFLLSDPGGLRSVTEYRGVPGQAGLSLLVQPDLAQFWLSGTLVSIGPLASELLDHSTLIIGIPMVAAVVLLIRNRVEPAVAATVLWIVFFIFSPSLLLHYAVWGLPFFLMAGYVKQVAALQAFLLVPIFIRYWVIGQGPWESDLVAGLYAALMIITTLAALAVLSILTLRIWKRGQSAQAVPVTRGSAR